MGQRSGKLIRCYHGASPEQSRRDHGTRTPAQVSTSRSSPNLASPSNGRSELMEVLDYVQKVLDRYKDRSGPKILPSEFTKEKITEASGLFDKISNAFDKQARHSKLKTTVAESKTLVQDVLEGVGKVDGVPGLGIIAFAASRLQDRVEKMSKIPEDVVDVLERLKLLGESILHADLRDGNKMLHKGLLLICVSVIWCEQRLQSGLLTRFGTVNITANDIKSLKEDVEKLCQELSMGIGIEGLQTARSLQRIATMPLQDYKVTFPAGAVGLGEPLEHVLELLEVRNGSLGKGVKAVLLYGIGGIGKTTLATAVCSQIKTAERHFANIEVGENPGLSKICMLQSEILERLCGRKQRIGSSVEGQSLLREQFAEHEGDPFVLFIDNVFDQKDLSTLLPDALDSLPDGSRLIVTSRSRQAMDAIDIKSKEEHCVEMLNDIDARELFNKHIESYPQEMEEEINTIVKLCGGLPLAIELVGSYLKNNVKRGRERSWMEVRENLKKCRVSSKGKEDQLNEILSWSYKSVSEGAQRLFVDICMIGGRWPRDKIDCFVPDSASALEELEDYALVTNSIYGSKAFDADEIDVLLYGGTISVHDVLGSFGESKAPSFTRILLEDQKSLKAFLQDDILKYKAAEILTVDLEESKDEMLQYPLPADLEESKDEMLQYPLPARTLDHMHKSLRFLHVHSGYIDGICGKIFSNLRIIFLIADGRSQRPIFPFEAISGLQQLHVLVVDGYSIPGIGDAQFPESLKVLELRNVNELEEFRSDAFEECGLSLDGLIIGSCENLVGLPKLWSSRAGEANPPALRTLSLYDCESLKALPDYLSNFQKLEALCVQDCPQVESFPEDLGKLRALKYLSLEMCSGLKELPSNIGDLSQLEHLDIRGCHSLEMLPESTSRLQNLKRIRIAGCPKLQQCHVLEEIQRSGKVHIFE